MSSAKPVVPYIVLRRVQSVIELFQARRQLEPCGGKPAGAICWLRQSRSSALNQGMIEALATAIEFRSEESGDHVRRIHDITKYTSAHYRVWARRSGRPRQIERDRPGLHHARRGEDRCARRHSQQARQTDARGVRDHENPHNPRCTRCWSSIPQLQRARVLPLRLRHRPPPPRALGRQRLSRRAERG